MATLFWGGNFVVGRLFRQDITPIALTFWRWLLALAILLPLSAAEMRREWRLILHSWKLIVGLSVSGITAYTICVYEAVRITSAVNAALFLATLPLMIVVANWLINRDRITGNQMLGMAISFGGAVVVVAHGSLALLLMLRFNIGDLWMLAAVPLWAIYAVLQRRRPTAISPLTLVTASVAAAQLLLTPAYLWETAHGGQTHWNIGTIFAVGYTAVLASAVSYVLWNRGAAALGPNRAGIYINLIPVFSALLAVLILGETLALYHIIGAALVACGIGVAHWHGRLPVPVRHYRDMMFGLLGKLKFRQRRPSGHVELP
ncbi:MAG TPA: DMT family transporter [Roseiflexaceae bacterium]|nr:DMT family transporter [Roseiflexaceae bacterium]